MGRNDARILSLGASFWTFTREALNSRPAAFDELAAESADSTFRAPVIPSLQLRYDNRQRWRQTPSRYLKPGNEPRGQPGRSTERTTNWF